MTDELKWPKLLTVTEVAAIARISKMTVYRLIQTGELEAKRVGGSYRILESSLRKAFGMENEG